MKIVKAVAPYQFKNGIDFKMKAYEAWQKAGGQVAESYYPPRWAHFFAHRIELPHLKMNDKEARLRFVQPVTFRFDTFPDYSRYEIIPFMWDTWEPFHETIAQFFIKYHIRTAIFCASQTAEVMRKRFPNMNILTITEGIDTLIYEEGLPLKDRSIDLLEFGRQNIKAANLLLPPQYNHLKSRRGVKLFRSDIEFRKNLADSKITLAFPKHDTCPEETGFVETLTQRYWENMLSRVLMIGKAPFELTNLIGYNPVIEIDTSNPTEQIENILSHIEDYQTFVNRNRVTALNRGDWSIRMNTIMKWLNKNGYIIK